MKGTVSNRQRKNGASREQWQKRKRAFNSAREPQDLFESTFEVGDSKVVKIKRTRE
jgi:hypothetical protein